MKDWIRSIGPMVVRLAAGWIALIALMVSLGMLLTGPLRDEWPLTLEDDLNTSLAANRSALANDITRWWSAIGNTLTIIVTLAVAAVVLRLILQRWRESLFVVAAVAGQALVFMVTSNLIDRERPDVPKLDDSPPTSSFPSGHTSAALALYLALALVVLWNVRRTWLAWLTAVVLLVLPVLVGTGRLYRGMHHPSDVAGSVLNATLCVALAWLVVQRLSRLPEHKAADSATAVPAADRRGVAA